MKFDPKTKLIYASVVSMVAIVLFSLSIFIVKEEFFGLVVRAGKVTNKIYSPGAHFKIPIVEESFLVDKRMQTVVPKKQEIISSDQKRIIIEAYVKYKIIDPLAFFVRFREIGVFNKKMSSVLESSIRSIIAESSFRDLLTDKRWEIMTSIESRVAEKVKSFGVEVVDVKIVRMELPEANQQSIFSRMRADREKEAKELRAIGKEEAEMVRFDADKNATIIIAKAEAKRGQVIGDAILQSNKMYELSAAKDPEFFNYYNKNMAYRKSMEKGGKTIFLTSKNDFMSTINSGK